MKNYLQTLADRTFFAPFETWQLEEGILSPDVPRGLVPLTGVPAEWRRRVSGPWTVVTPPGHAMPDQGWKIHLAPAVSSAASVFERAVEFCVESDLAFKVVTRLEYAWALNGKYAPREASGKTFVVYPSVSDPSGIADVLATLFADVPGPRVLGSHRVRGSIAHLRYGGFIKRYTRDTDGEPCLAVHGIDGELVPDLRGVIPQVPQGVPLPKVLAQTPALPAAVSASTHIYKVTGALHFSNTGGVYQATDTSTGKEVVLKEARHQTGYDAAMDSAVDRLRRQRDAMITLADSGFVGPVIDYFTQGDSDFLAYGFAPGSTLQEWAASHSPALFLTDPAKPVEQSTADAYAARVSEIVSRLDDLVSSVHSVGIVLGDLHPANVIIGDDGRLTLIDLEAAAPESDDHRFVGAAGFFNPSLRGADIDAHGLAATHLYMYNPVVATSGFQRGGLERSVAHAQHIYGRDEAWANRMRGTLRATSHDEGAAPEPREAADGLLSGLASRIDFDREFPIMCSPLGYEMHESLSISWGAPGAVFALAACGALPDGLGDHYARWIEPRVDSLTALGSGLLDGWAGNIVVADAVGHHDLADTLLTHLLTVADIDQTPLRLRSGLAGLLAMCLHRNTVQSGSVDDGVVEKLADVLADRAAESLSIPGRPVAGLLDGCSGMALALGRAYRVVPKPEYLVTARDLLAAELSTYEHHGGALFHYDSKSRILGYLDRGNAGFVLAAAELRDIADIRDDTLRHLHRGSCARIGVAPGLYFGLAGGLAATAQLGELGVFNRDEVTAASKAQATAVASFLGHGLDGRGMLAPGALSVRASDDFATGAAGIALALAVSCGRSSTWLAGVF